LASRYRLAPARREIDSPRAGATLYQLGEKLFLGEPTQAAPRGQRRRPPVGPRAGAVLPGVFFINAINENTNAYIVFFSTVGLA
jgi:hypothetical protein